MAVPTGKDGRCSIFISYSHRDEPWKDRLVTHLRAVTRQGDLEVWDDRRIGAGDCWKDEIQAALGRARVAILVVTAHFLNSRFIQEEELPTLWRRHQEEGVRLIPLLAKPCAWEAFPWLHELQGRPTDAKWLSGMRGHEKDQALADLTRELLELLRPCRAGVPEVGPPLVLEAERSNGPEPESMATTSEEDVTAARRPSAVGAETDTAPRTWISQLPPTGKPFVGRNEELRLLDSAWEDPRTHIVSIVGPGGTGKTSLVQHWLDRMAGQGYRGAEAVYAWSFYAQGDQGLGTSGDAFMQHALAFFGDSNPSAGSPFDRGARLGKLIGRSRIILVLDGLETVQGSATPDGGFVSDPGVTGLLRELANQNAGLCVVTTRNEVADLESQEVRSVMLLHLENLNPEEGAFLLRSRGVKGRPEALRESSQALDGHALSLILLGSYVRVALDGNLDRLGILATPPSGVGGVAMAASLEAHLDRLPQRERELLLLLGLFDAPAERAAMAVLTAAPIAGLVESLSGASETQVAASVAGLQRHGLVMQDGSASQWTLNVHPLIRSHLARHVRDQMPEAWREGHRRLYEFRRKAAPELPEHLVEMMPLYAAVRHGCNAGRFQETYDEVFWPRIRRGEQSFSIHRLGALSAELGALAAFFEDSQFRTPARSLRPACRGFLLNEAGFVLGALGRLAEAEIPLREGLKEAAGQSDWRQAAIRAGNLSELHQALGMLGQALQDAQRAVTYADRSGDLFQRASKRATLADAFHQLGEPAVARRWFEEAEALQAKHKPKHPLLHSLRGYQFNNLLLEEGQPKLVLQRAERALASDTEVQVRLSMALDHMSLGRAYLCLGILDRAVHHVEEAMVGFRQSGDQEFIARGLAVRGALYTKKGNFGAAQACLEDALAMARRNQMLLVLADSLLEKAHLQGALKDRDGRQSSLAEAQTIVDECGYRRIAQELATLRSAPA